MHRCMALLAVCARLARGADPIDSTQRVATLTFTAPPSNLVPDQEVTLQVTASSAHGAAIPSPTNPVVNERSGGGDVTTAGVLKARAWAERITGQPNLLNVRGLSRDDMALSTTVTHR